MQRHSEIRERRFTEENDGVFFNCWTERFDSMHSFLEICQSRTKQPDFSRDVFAGGSDHRYAKWQGCGTIKETIELVTKGWEEPIGEINKTVREAQQIPAAKRMKIFNDVEGYAPIVPAALVGHPLSMVNMKLKRTKVRVVDVYVDIGALCNVTADEMMRSAKVVLSELVGLEMQGYRARINIVDFFTEAPVSTGVIIKIKDESQPFDLKRITFPLIHPAMSRMLLFGWFERFPHSAYVGPGYGRLLHNEYDKVEVRKIIGKCFGKHAIYLSGQQIGWKGDNYINELVEGFNKNQNR